MNGLLSTGHINSCISTGLINSRLTTGHTNRFLVTVPNSNSNDNSISNFKSSSISNSRNKSTSLNDNGFDYFSLNYGINFSDLNDGRLTIDFSNDRLVAIHI